VLAVRRVLRRVHGEPGRHMGRNARTDPTPPPSPAPLPASPEDLSTGTDPPQAPRGPYPRQEPVGQDLRPPAPMPGDHRTPATTPAVPAPEDIVATDRFPPRRPRQEPPRTPSPRP
jgi:translation initiation factor IF-2